MRRLGATSRSRRSNDSRDSPRGSGSGRRLKARSGGGGGGGGGGSSSSRSRDVPPDDYDADTERSGREGYSRGTPSAASSSHSRPSAAAQPPAAPEGWYGNTVPKVYSNNSRGSSYNAEDYGTGAAVPYDAYTRNLLASGWPDGSASPIMMARPASRGSHGSGGSNNNRNSNSNNHHSGRRYRSSKAGSGSGGHKAARPPRAGSATSYRSGSSSPRAQRHAATAALANGSSRSVGGYYNTKGTRPAMGIAVGSSRSVGGRSSTRRKPAAGTGAAAARGRRSRTSNSRSYAYEQASARTLNSSGRVQQSRRAAGGAHGARVAGAGVVRVRVSSSARR